MSIFGIDLGTTYSAIARMEDGRAAVIPNNIDGGGNPSTLPSVVYFGEDSIEVGPSAKSNQGIEPENVVAFIKQEMGNVEFSFAPASRKGTEKENYNPVEISELILKKLKKYAEEYTQEEVKQVYITIPARFGEVARENTIQAGKNAGFEVLGVLNEPVAAVLAYKAKFPNAKGTVLVYDLGGGTFDVALVDLNENKVTGKDGDERLGGKLWDEALVDKIFIPKWQEKIKSEKNLEPLSEDDIRSKYSLYNAWMLKAEEIKIALSGARGKAKVNLEAEDFGTVSFEVTREEFDEATKHLLDLTINITERLLNPRRLPGTGGSGAAAPAVDTHFDAILLVGGSTYMPQVKKRLKEKYGMDPIIDDPNLAVAKGAAIFGEGVVVPDDVLGKTYGLVCVENDGKTEFSSSMLLRNAPMKEAVYENDNFNPLHDNSPALNLVITESDDGDYRVDDPSTHQLPMIKVSPIGEGIIELPPNTPKTQKIRVRFEVDRNQILTAFFALVGNEKVNKTLTIQLYQNKGRAIPATKEEVE